MGEDGRGYERMEEDFLFILLLPLAILLYPLAILLLSSCIL